MQKVSCCTNKCMVLIKYDYEEKQVMSLCIFLVFKKSLGYMNAYYYTSPGPRVTYARWYRLRVMFPFIHAKCCLKYIALRSQQPKDFCIIYAIIRVLLGILISSSFVFKTGTFHHTPHMLWDWLNYKILMAT